MCALKVKRLEVKCAVSWKDVGEGPFFLPPLKAEAPLEKSPRDLTVQTSNPLASQILNCLNP